MKEKNGLLKILNEWNIVWNLIFIFTFFHKFIHHIFCAHNVKPNCNLFVKYDLFWKLSNFDSISKYFELYLDFSVQFIIRYGPPIRVWFSKTQFSGSDIALCRTWYQAVVIYVFTQIYNPQYVSKWKQLFGALLN